MTAVLLFAQSKNEYHELGDFAPFGDISLFEWKLTQLLNIFDKKDIFLSTDKDIKTDINVIKRTKSNFKDILIEAVEQIEYENILIANLTSPFISENIYKSILDTFHKKNLSSLVTIEKKKEFIYFENSKNFDKFIDRRKEIKIVTNGVYLTKRDLILKYQDLAYNPYLYELDSFSAMEIKDISSYELLNEMIFLYFKKELG